MMASLRQQAGLQAALATGDWREPALLKLHHAGIDVIGLPGAFGGDSVTREGIAQIALKRAGTVAGEIAERAVFVGDAEWDVRTCIMLRLPFVGIGRGQGAERLRAAGAGAVIEAFGEDFNSVLDKATCHRHADRAVAIGANSSEYTRDSAEGNEPSDLSVRNAIEISARTKRTGRWGWHKAGSSP